MKNKETKYYNYFSENNSYSRNIGGQYLSSSNEELKLLDKKIQYRMHYAEKVLSYKLKLKDKNINKNKKLKLNQKLQKAQYLIQGLALAKEELNKFIEFYSPDVQSTLVIDLLKDPYYIFACYGSNVFPLMNSSAGMSNFLSPIKLLDHIRNNNAYRIEDPEAKFLAYVDVARDESSTLKKYNNVAASNVQKFKNIAVSVGKEIELLREQKLFSKDSKEFKKLEAEISELRRTRENFTPEESEKLINYFKIHFAFNKVSECGVDAIVNKLILPIINDPYRFFADSQMEIDYYDSTIKLDFNAIKELRSDPINFCSKQLEKYIVPKNKDEKNIQCADVLNEKDKQCLEIARDNSDTWFIDKYSHKLFKIIQCSKEIDILNYNIKNNKDESNNLNFKEELESLKKKKEGYLNKSERDEVIKYFSESGLPDFIVQRFINIVKFDGYYFPFCNQMKILDKFEVIDQNNKLLLSLDSGDFEFDPCKTFTKLKKVKEHIKDEKSIKITSEAQKQQAEKLKKSMMCATTGGLFKENNKCNLI